MNADIDQASLQLINDIQSQDAEALIRGKRREGDDVSDVELAAELYKLELESLPAFYSDRALCRLIHGNRLDAGEILRDDPDEERQATNRQATSEQATHEREHAPDDNAPRRISSMPDAPEIVVDEASTSTSVTPASEASEASEQRYCVACMTNVPSSETLQCPCSDIYCHGCITDLFKAAMKDESLFLPAELVVEYQAKELEHNTSDKTYCCLSTCSAFIPPSSIQGDIATCGECQSKTCIVCKGLSHQDDCPEDVTTKELIRIAAKNNWQRCYPCRRMVELNTGCNHITCRCKAQFCYVCGKQWKQCGCEQWDEARLLDRATLVQDRAAGRFRMAQEAARAAGVARERAHLAENHECLHQIWRWREGEFQCEECHADMPEFIYECRVCRVQLCRRCRDNRL
ncbi:hypothetical protein V8C37DRAFT_407427 [Trichoderma ceciliae]